MNTAVHAATGLKHRNKTAILIIVALTTVLLTACSGDVGVAKDIEVGNGVTYGQLLDSDICDKSKWSSYKDDKGNRFAKAVCVLDPQKVPMAEVVRQAKERSVASANADANGLDGVIKRAEIELRQRIAYLDMDRKYLSQQAYEDGMKPMQEALASAHEYKARQLPRIQAKLKTDLGIIDAEWNLDKPAQGTFVFYINDDKSRLIELFVEAGDKKWSIESYDVFRYLVFAAERDVGKQLKWWNEVLPRTFMPQLSPPVER